ncbi:MAG: hypothetical protein ACI4O4_00875 [Candidatus Ventricola sp.]
MSIKPILFNTEMVRAILDWRKTQTRRIVRIKDGACDLRLYSDIAARRFISDSNAVRKLNIDVGDILWVRETWTWFPAVECATPCIGPCKRYKDEYGCFVYKAGNPIQNFTWKPSIHMPREAARIFLRVKDVRVERLQDITEDDVCAEGAEPIIRCNRQHPVYDRNGVPGDMCWNTNSACKDCPEFKSYAELFGEMVWNETIKKSDMDKYGWSANPWVWVIEFERCEKP